MSDVVSFRPTGEDLEAIEAARLRMGFATRAQAVRYLLHQGAASQRPLAEDPVFAFRVPPEFRGGPDLAADDIDAALYGSPP